MKHKLSIETLYESEPHLAAEYYHRLVDALFTNLYERGSLDAADLDCWWHVLQTLHELQVRTAKKIAA